MWPIWETHLQNQPSLWEILCCWQNWNNSGWRPCVQDGLGMKETLITRCFFTLICRFFFHVHSHQHNFFFLAIFFVLFKVQEVLWHCEVPVISDHIIFWHTCSNHIFSFPGGYGRRDWSITDFTALLKHLLKFCANRNIGIQICVQEFASHVRYV